MTTTDLDTPLIDAVCNHLRKLTAEVAATPDRYPTRQRRRELFAETDAELDNLNRLRRCEPR